MNKSSARLVLAAAMSLAVWPALAQGTDAQREACAPDAVKLCQDTIPDIPRTTACMKAHFAQLSPRCQVAFGEVTGGGAPKAGRRQAEAPPSRPVEAASDSATDAAPEDGFGLHAYAKQIRGYCRQGLIDPFTCRNTLETLRGME